MQVGRWLPWKVLAAALAVSVGALSGRPALGQADAGYDEHAAEREAARVDRSWNRYWREFAPYYLEHDGAFVCVPGYDRRLPSSAGVGVRDYQDDSAWDQEYTDERGRERTRRLVKPEAEAHAAVATIQRVEVGQYGYIHSGHIASIEDERTVELSRVWLLDAAAAEEEKKEMKEQVVRGVFEDIEGAIRNRGRDERRNRGDGIARRRAAENESIDWAFEDRTAAAERQRGRDFSRYRWEVVGYQTGRLEAGSRWPTGRAAEEGLQLVIVAVEGNTVTAVPAETIGRGISELQFLGCIEARGLTKADFVELVTEVRREERSGYVPLVLARIEGSDPADDPAAGPNDTVELAD